MTLSEPKIKTSEKDTKQKILDAAINIFANKGYHDTRVDEIVERSQTSKGAVYFYFPSKEQIFLAIINKFASMLKERLVDAIEAEESGVNKVNAALHTSLEVFGQYRSLAKIFLVQATGLGKIFEEKRIEIHNQFAVVIKNQLDQAVKEGGIPAIDTEIASYVWMGAINDVIIRWVQTGQPDPSRAIPVLRTMLLQSIGVPEARIRSFNDDH